MQVQVLLPAPNKRATLAVALLFGLGYGAEAVAKRAGATERSEEVPPTAAPVTYEHTPLLQANSYLNLLSSPLAFSDAAARPSPVTLPNSAIAGVILPQLTILPQPTSQRLENYYEHYT